MRTRYLMSTIVIFLPLMASVQGDNLRNVSYEIGSKEQKDALYRIKISTNQLTFKRLADIASSPCLNEILEKVECKLEREKEKRQIAFT